MQRLCRVFLQALSGVLLCVSHTAASGQLLRLVVPFAAGGGGDQLARVLAPVLSKELGIPVFVENVPGANGTVGMQRVAGAASTDQVLVVASEHAAVIAPLRRPLIGYDTRTTFAMAGFVARYRYALVVSTTSGSRSLTELVEELRSRSAMGNLAVPAEGGLPELMAQELSKMAGVEITVVPFRGGNPATTALLAGYVNAAAVGIGNALALHRAGKLRILALSGESRSPTAPEVPTLSELGLPALGVSSGWAMYAVKSTTMDLVRFNRVLRKVLSQTATRNRLQAIGMELVPMDIEESNAELAKAFTAWAPLKPSRGIASPRETSSSAFASPPDHVEP